MIILAIDTSCDDTCIAILEMGNGKWEIKSNVVSSQVKIHQKYGGVYPTLAKREHQRNLVPVLEKALKEADLLEKSKCQMSNVKSISNVECQTLEKILEREAELVKELVKFFQRYQKPKIDAIAVTVGPGLEPCLWVGVNFAKALSYYWQKPLIPVNHIEAHIIANFVGECQMSNVKCQIFPAVALVVSGGHTQLILFKDVGKYKIIGETRDDAAGECFDKTARILGLTYPGGPAIAQEAASFRHDREKMKLGKLITLPRPMIYSKDYDFSFSGLKTAVLYDYKKRAKTVRESKEYIRAMAKEIQQAIIDVLIKKTIKAARDYKTKSIILGGGVAANKELRRQFQQKIEKGKIGFKFHVPSFKMCTDNAAMVGVTAYFHSKNKKSWKQIAAKANLRI